MPGFWILYGQKPKKSIENFWVKKEIHSQLSFNIIGYLDDEKEEHGTQKNYVRCYEMRMSVLFSNLQGIKLTLIQ